MNCCRENCFKLDAEFDTEKFQNLVRKAFDECFSFCRSHEETEEINDPHTVAETMCWKCGKRWIAAFPSATLLKQLECPGCGSVGHAFLTGQDVEQEA